MGRGKHRCSNKPACNEIKARSNKPACKEQVARKREKQPGEGTGTNRHKNDQVVNIYRNHSHEKKQSGDGNTQYAHTSEYVHALDKQSCVGRSGAGANVHKHKATEAALQSRERNKPASKPAQKRQWKGETDQYTNGNSKPINVGQVIHAHAQR